jgi:ferredoxin-NADP reductase
VLREPAGRGGSAYLYDQVSEGTELTIRGPRNAFALESADRYSFIAGGIGVTPILPMARHAHAAGIPFSMTYGGRSLETMAFRSELLHGVKVVTEDTSGFIDLTAALADVDTGTLVYCCGPAALIEAVRGQCRERWPDTDLVRYELFAATDEPLHNDDDAAFDVTLVKAGTSIVVRSDESILDAVVAAGLDIDMPWDCQEGVCGSCETRVLSGGVDHRDHVLTSKERAVGDRMMICVSRGTDRSLVLDL